MNLIKIKRDAKVYSKPGFLPRFFSNRQKEPVNVPGEKIIRVQCVKMGSRWLVSEVLVDNIGWVSLSETLPLLSPKGIYSELRRKFTLPKSLKYPKNWQVKEKHV